MGFYSPHTLVQDARRHGVEVRTPDLNASGAGATLEVDVLRTDRAAGDLVMAGSARADAPAWTEQPRAGGPAAAVDGRVGASGAGGLVGASGARGLVEARAGVGSLADGPVSGDGSAVEGRPAGVRLGPAPVGAPPEEWGRGGPAVRLGLGSVRGLGDDLAARIVAERTAHGPYADPEDLVRRVPGLSVAQLEALATAGAFGCFGLDRRRALWVAGAVAR